MKNIFDKIKNPTSKVKQVVEKPFKKLIEANEKWMQTKLMQWFFRVPFVGYLVLAFVLNLLLETLSRHSLFKAIRFIGASPLVFIYNAFIIFVTLSLVLFAKRKVFATIFVCAIWVLSAFANWIVLCFRTTPFSAVDILMIRNVLTMLDKYMTKWQMVLSAIGILCVVFLLIYLYIRLPKTKQKRHPFRASAYVCMCGVFVVAITKVAVDTHTVSDNFGNLAYAYNDYGFAYCFSNSIIDVGISKPKEYGEETILDIVHDLKYNKSEVILVSKEEAEMEQMISVTTEVASKQEQVTEAENVGGEQDSMESDSQVNEVDITTEERPAKSDGRIDEDIIAALQGTNMDETFQKNDEKSDISTSDKMEDLDKDVKKVEDLYYKNLPATKKYPNIVVIQLESVFDTKYMKDFYASENPMPFLSKLKRKYSSGLFTVPAVGAGTANTEFEVQTGMSTQFFGAGEYPFKTVMRDVSCGSIAYDLKRQGYATAGFHNNDATFYERYIDYSNLGFDSFSGMEHMYQLNYTPRGWAKDDVLDNIMLERMKQTEGRDYITTITVQCHGRYPKKHTDTLTDLDCFFTGEYEGDKAKQAAWEYYINMCKECDNMLKDFITKLEEFGEPTVVFMYGDHLPSLDLQDTDLDGISLYETEWVMWDNIGLKKKNVDMTAYQASTYLFNRLNLEGGLMQNFHNAYMNIENKEEYLDMLELLEYDTLYGNNYAYDCTNPFPQTQMKIGIRDVVVEKCVTVGDFVRITGQNFNEFSEIYINGKAVETTYINTGVVAISVEDYEDAKELQVMQVGDDHIVLSKSDVFLVEEGEIIGKEKDVKNEQENDTENNVAGENDMN